MSATDLINLSAYRRAELDAIDRETTKRLLYALMAEGTALTPPVLAVRERLERERPWRPAVRSRRPMAVPDCGHDVAGIWFSGWAWGLVTTGAGALLLGVVVPFLMAAIGR